MFIDINTIGPEGLAFDARLRLRRLEGPSGESLDDVEARLAGEIRPEGRGADLSGRLETTVTLRCSRCLESFPWSLRTDFDLAVVPVHAGAPSDEPAGGEADASVLAAPEGKIALEDVATEQLYLSLPLKPVCRESCRGLCPNCGADRNNDPCTCTAEAIDPRLAPLLPFRKRSHE